MAYTITRPRADFKIAIVEIIRRVRLAEQKHTPTAIREYVLAASIFLAHAEFENYYTDALDRLARLYSLHSSNGLSLPLRLRAFLFLHRSGLQHAVGAKLAGGEEQALLKVAESSFSGGAGSIIDPSIALTPFSGESIHGEYSYPSIKNIERTLRRIGIGDPKGALNRAARADVVSLLDSIASLRTSLAHSAALPGTSANDVVARIRGLERFVRAFDRALYSHVRSSHSNRAWQTSMP